jgi:hypothetical protein
MVATKTAARDEKGRLLPRPDSLVKAFAVRVRKDLEPFIAADSAMKGLAQLSGAENRLKQQSKRKRKPSSY